MLIINDKTLQILPSSLFENTKTNINQDFILSRDFILNRTVVFNSDTNSIVYKAIDNKYEKFKNQIIKNSINHDNLANPNIIKTFLYRDLKMKYKQALNDFCLNIFYNFQTNIKLLDHANYNITLNIKYFEQYMSHINNKIMKLSYINQHNIAEHIKLSKNSILHSAQIKSLPELEWTREVLNFTVNSP